MEIIRRLKVLIIFLYITGKWLGLTAWWVILASMIWAEGFVILLAPQGETTFGIVMAILLIIPLVILSVIEWVVFGKLTWSYKSFEKTD